MYVKKMFERVLPKNPMYLFSECCIETKSTQKCVCYLRHRERKEISVILVREKCYSGII